jgi:hypothetical protein
VKVGKTVYYPDNLDWLMATLQRPVRSHRQQHRA